MAELQTAHTSDLDPEVLQAGRALLYNVFDDMTELDWEHSLGGIHALIWEGSELIGHGSVIQRRLLHGGRAWRAGYVEGMGVRADRRGRGHGTTMMAALERVISRAYDLGGTVVSRIEPGPARDLAYQESLTAALLKARPIYDQAERDTVTNTGDYWADAVTSIVGAPVVIRSHGPAATDKAWRSPQTLSR